MQHPSASRQRDPRPVQTDDADILPWPLCPFDRHAMPDADTVPLVPGNSARPNPLAAPMPGGAHHCISTANGVVDIVFRYLHANCASHGGILSEADLLAAQADLVDSCLCGSITSSKIKTAA